MSSRHTWSSEGALSEEKESLVSEDHSQTWHGTMPTRKMQDQQYRPAPPRLSGIRNSMTGEEEHAVDLLSTMFGSVEETEQPYTHADMKRDIKAAREREAADKPHPKPHKPPQNASTQSQSSPRQHRRRRSQSDPTILSRAIIKVKGMFPCPSSKKRPSSRRKSQTDAKTKSRTAKWNDGVDGLDARRISIAIGLDNSMGLDANTSQPTEVNDLRNSTGNSNAASGDSPSSHRLPPLKVDLPAFQT